MHNAAVIFFIATLAASFTVLARPPKSLVAKVEPTPAARSANATKLKELAQEYGKRAQRLGLPADEKTARREAKRILSEQMTLQEYLSSVTPQSRTWIREFFNNTRRTGTDPFDQFVERYKDESIADVKALLRSRSRASKQEEPAPTALAACPDTGEPHIDDISGSKLIRKRTYNCEKRHIVATPEQALRYRGRNNESQSPYFPDYDNVYCDACCGPSAGQSILEWFNVAVRWASGSTAVGSNDIQHRLANLMETQDGIDYTDPDDLARTLMRSEFVGSKGYCYMPSDGTMSDVRYMLSAGTPVILLIAEDDWAHYVTLYGFDQEADKFFVANDDDYAAQKLKDLWDFDNVDWYLDTAFALGGVTPNMLFSYSPTGCDREWAYVLRHTEVDPWEVSDRAGLYFDEFNEEHVAGHNEDGMKLNFIGVYALDFQLGGDALLTAITNVGHGSQSVNLGYTNSHIIAHASHAAGLVPNSSIGRPLGFEVRVDKQFINTYPEVYVGFTVRNSNGTAVVNRYARYTSYYDAAASATDPQNYVFRLNNPYSQNYRTVEFKVHGGLRKVEWTLAGCLRDGDGDGICNEYDTDWDNDGVPNDADNCPHHANPGQEATIDPGGAGDACWRYTLPVLDWAKGLVPDERIPAMLAALEKLTGQPRNPCDCRGLCLTCPAEFNNIAGELKRFASRHVDGALSSKAFSSQLQEFFTGFQFQSKDVNVVESRLTRSGRRPAVVMNLIARQTGDLTVRVPDVILDNRILGIRTGLRVQVDGDRVAANEAREGGARVLKIRVPAGARSIRISGNRSEFH